MRARLAGIGVWLHGLVAKVWLQCSKAEQTTVTQMVSRVSLQQRFAGVAGDGFAGGVAEAD
jgi:hypothetical protein